MQGINSVGCDSIIDVDLTIYNSNDTVITITECSGYVFNGNLIDSSGVYLFNATNSSGCDSSIVLDATIIQKPNAGKDSLYSYCANGDEVFDMNLFLEFGTDLSGIWIDIDTTGLLDLSIFNSSGADFGTWNFAYVLSDLNCNSDTAIVQLDIMYCLSIGQVYSTQIKISPNPATDFVDITSPFSGKIFIIDILGKTVYESEIKASAHINTKDFSKGVYTVLIKNPEQSIIGKLVVE